MPRYTEVIPTRQTGAGRARARAVERTPLAVLMGCAIVKTRSKRALAVRATGGGVVTVSWLSGRQRTKGV